MELVPGFAVLLQPFSSAMTRPTFESFATLAAGWVLASRRIVTRMILATGESADKHYSPYHRVFSAARWSLDRVGLAAFDHIAQCINGDALLALDDTLAHKQLGRAGRDGGTAVSQRSLLLVANLVSLVSEQGEGRKASARRPGTNGRPRKPGMLLPTPAAMLDERRRHLEFQIYGQVQTARLADCVAQVHKVPDRPLRVVAIEPLTGGRQPQAFYAICHDASAEQVIAWYASRGSIKVAFHDSKQHLGFEQPQGWSRRSVEWTVPLAMLWYTLVIMWYGQEGHRHYRPLDCPWHASKTHPSFADLLVTLKP